MVIRNISLETVCGITSALPENIHPEVAFAGKSNVGKSFGQIIHNEIPLKSRLVSKLSLAKPLNQILII